MQPGCIVTVVSPLQNTSVKWNAEDGTYVTERLLVSKLQEHIHEK
jgi:hypothetical protein